MSFKAVAFHEIAIEVKVARIAAKAKALRPNLIDSRGIVAVFAARNIVNGNEQEDRAAKATTRLLVDAKIPDHRHAHVNTFWFARMDAVVAEEVRRIGDDEIWFAPPEYVILWKLEFFREGGGDKHLRDIRGMLLVNAETIDRAMLDRAASELGLGAHWALAQSG